MTVPKSPRVKLRIWHFLFLPPMTGGKEHHKEQWISCNPIQSYFSQSSRCREVL